MKKSTRDGLEGGLAMLKKIHDDIVIFAPLDPCADSQRRHARSDGGGGGCSHPVGAKWDRWDMAAST